MTDRLHELGAVSSKPRPARDVFCDARPWRRLGAPDGGPAERWCCGL